MPSKYTLKNSSMNGHKALSITPMKFVDALHKPKGITQYCRKFIANFFAIAAPMNVVTNVKKGFQWGGKQKKAFEALK